MKFLKPLAASIAATALMLSQAAAAQPASPEVGELGVPHAAEPVFFILGFVALAIIAGLLFEDNDDNNSAPASP